MTFASTILYFVQSHLVGEAISRPRAAPGLSGPPRSRGQYVLTVVTQTLLTARIVRRLGVAATLSRCCRRWRRSALHRARQPPRPRMAHSAHCWSFACSTTAAATRSPSRPARCCSPDLGREQRYKSKAFIDAAVYRGGDLLSGWIYAGLAAARHDRRSHRPEPPRRWRCLWGAARLAVGAERESDPRNRMTCRNFATRFILEIAD
jgi:AAA family ATP:ADP antiporter